MDLDEFALRFPDLDLTRTSPTLFRLNGVGFGLYGRRAADRETGTYVKSHCFCFLWIPLLPIASYRVADADRGWYILGRLPASGTERLVRGAVAAGVLVALVALAWTGFTSTDSYRDRETWARAEEAIDAGRLVPAARALQRIARDNPRLRADARTALADLVAGVGPDTAPGDAQVVFELAADPHDGAGPVSADIWPSVVSYASSGNTMTAQSRVQILDALADAAPTPEVVAAARRTLLERAATAGTPDTWALSELATILEADGDVAGCQELLEPRRNSLGDLEGARILGRIYARQGRLEDSFTLLQPYVDGRLARLAKAESAFDASFQAARQDALERLDNGAGGRTWYERYDAADGSGQRAMVDAWLGKALESDPRYVVARDDYVAATAVVPVAMDLGIVRMQRARGMDDALEARREMEAAENVFKAIHGAAQGDPDYLLTMARVAFWLGKGEECRGYLDAALAASDDPFTTNMEVGGVLSALGETDGARRHWEQAYESAPGNAERQGAAAAIAAILCRTDPEEAIVWFERANTEFPAVGGSYAVARAQMALRAGDVTAATAEFESALALYDRAQESAANLNNSALAAQDLAMLTGDLPALEDAAARMRKAVAAMPTDVIVMQNAAGALLTLASARVLGDVSDLTPGTDVLWATMYDEADGRDVIARRLATLPETAEAVRILERCSALAARNADVIMMRAGLATKTRDAATLRSLLAHVTETPPDTEAGRRAYMKALAEPVEAAPLVGALRHVMSLLAALPPDADARTRIALQSRKISLAVAAGVAGADLATIDGLRADALGRTARELHAAHPNSATRRAARDAALLALHERMLAADATYAAESGRHAARVGPKLLIAEALHRDAALRERVRGTDEFARLLEFLEESARKFPDELGPTSWALLRFGTPQQVRIARESRPDDVDAMVTAIVSACSPFAAGSALRQAWIHRAAGDEAAADAVLDACAEFGASIPYRD